MFSSEICTPRWIRERKAWHNVSVVSVEPPNCQNNELRLRNVLLSLPMVDLLSFPVPWTWASPGQSAGRGDWCSPGGVTSVPQNGNWLSQQPGYYSPCGQPKHCASMKDFLVLNAATWERLNYSKDKICLFLLVISLFCQVNPITTAQTLKSAKGELTFKKLVRCLPLAAATYNHDTYNSWHVYL